MLTVPYPTDAPATGGNSLDTNLNLYYQSGDMAFIIIAAAMVWLMVPGESPLPCHPGSFRRLRGNSGVQEAGHRVIGELEGASSRYSETDVCQALRSSTLGSPVVNPHFRCCGSVWWPSR